LAESIKHIKNPLTVIALFSGITETGGTLILPFIEPANQITYIWFLILFPIALVSAFFLTLNLNHKVLYAPSDYQNEENFLKGFYKASAKDKDKKLREEIKETTQKGNFNVQGCKITHHPEPYPSSLLSDLVLADKLAIYKLSKDLNLNFKTDVQLDIQGNRKILFDGFATDDDEMHAAEVKLFRTTIDLSRVHTFCSEVERVEHYLKDIEHRTFIAHFITVIDGETNDTKETKSKLLNHLKNYNANIKLHVFTLSDLKNDYLYNP
jgi:hypothetical protein